MIQDPLSFQWHDKFDWLEIITNNSIKNRPFLAKQVLSYGDTVETGLYYFKPKRSKQSLSRASCIIENSRRYSGVNHKMWWIPSNKAKSKVHLRAPNGAQYSAVSSEHLFNYANQFHPDFAEWLLFHPEWL